MFFVNILILSCVSFEISEFVQRFPVQLEAYILHLVTMTGLLHIQAKTQA